MTEQEILQRVRHVMQEHLQVANPIGLETDLFRDLQLDSLKQLTLIVELENQFRVCFDTGDEEGLRTVRDVVHLIGRRLENGPAYRSEEHA